MLENLTTGVLALAGDLSVRYANPAAEQLLGVSLHQLAGRPLPAVAPALAALEPLLLRALDTGRGFARRELTVAAWGETELALDCAVTIVEGGEGDPGLLLELSDASRRVRIDREHALLAQLDASRSMVRQLAHELRNPLGGIRGAAQLLERQLDQPVLRDYTGLIIREADRLAALAAALLGPAGPPERTELNIHEMVEHVRRLAKAEAGPRLVVERDYDPSIPVVAVDRNQIVQAMLNLVRNALAALDGRGRLVFRTRALMNETIGSRPCRLAACVEIEDDGPGVPDALRDTLFYPLVSGRAGGSGLGLALAQELVSRHGGLIEYTSRPGRTVFRMLFPIDEAQR